MDWCKTQQDLLIKPTCPACRCRIFTFDAYFQNPINFTRLFQILGGVKIYEQGEITEVKLDVPNSLLLIYERFLQGGPINLTDIDLEYNGQKLYFTDPTAKNADLYFQVLFYEPENYSENDYEIYIDPETYLKPSNADVNIIKKIDKASYFSGGINEDGNTDVIESKISNSTSGKKKKLSSLDKWHQTRDKFYQNPFGTSLKPGVQNMFLSNSISSYNKAKIAANPGLLSLGSSSYVKPQAKPPVPAFLPATYSQPPKPAANVQHIQPVQPRPIPPASPGYYNSDTRDTYLTTNCFREQTQIPV
jgi:hypothetical protein